MQDWQGSSRQTGTCTSDMAVNVECDCCRHMLMRDGQLIGTQ